MFDALAEWVADEEFRGCALVNASADLCDTAPAVRRQAEDYKRALRVYLSELLRESGRHGDDAELSAQRMLLVDGAIVQASIAGDAGAAQRAPDMAEHLLTCPERLCQAVARGLSVGRGVCALEEGRCARAPGLPSVRDQGWLPGRRRDG